MAVPLFPPKQEMFVCEEVAVTEVLGCVIIIPDDEAVHPFESETTTE